MTLRMICSARLVGLAVYGVAKLALQIVTHRPKTAASDLTNKLLIARGNLVAVFPCVLRGENLLRDGGQFGTAIAQLAAQIVTHRPQAAVGFEDQASGRLPAAIAVTPLSTISSATVGLDQRGVAKLAGGSGAHPPKTAVGFDKQAVFKTRRNGG